MGRSPTIRGAIEGSHELRTLARNFRDGEVQPHNPDLLDYMRAGSSMSGFGSSPWLAMRFSPSLRAAYDEIGGQRPGNNGRDDVFDSDGEPVGLDHSALESGSTDGRSAHSPATANGPVPDWLQENSPVPAADSVQDTTIHGTDQYNANERSNAQTVGTVRLEPVQESRRQLIDDTLARLADPQTATGQAAHKTLTHYVGKDNADLIQTAVSEHSATVVQEATAVTANLVAQYQQQGLSDGQQLAAFQSGEATATIREVIETPLSDEHLAAVADLMLQPQRRLTRTELVTVIGQQVATGATNEQAVAQAIGSPIGFGGQTGNVRGLLAGAKTMKLSATELTRLATMIQDGLRDAVQTELLGRGYQMNQVSNLINDMTALPTTLIVPQSTAVQRLFVERPQPHEEDEE